jgi:hypothetical protein
MSVALCALPRAAQYQHQQISGYFHFFNAPHLNNRPLKTSLAYAKLKLNRRVGRQRQPVFILPCERQKPDYHPPWRLYQLVLRIQPSYCSLWHLLVHLGVFNRQEVRRLRSHCRGSLLHFLGCSCLDPPTFASAIKCHQKSTSNSAGSSVGSLAPPPRATPRLGGVYVSCQYLPCSFVLCTRPARARPSIGGQSPNSRSAPAPVESSPGLVLWPVTVLEFCSLAH